jgi:hypothetical protein
MELRIREGDEGARAARVTKAQRVRPFDRLRDPSSLAVRSVSLSNWPLSSGAGAPSVRSVSLSNWPLLVAQGRKPPPVIPAKAWNPWILNAKNGTPHARSLLLHEVAKALGPLRQAQGPDFSCSFPCNSVLIRGSASF